MGKIEQKLADLKLELPETPKANGLYEIYRIETGVVYTSGQLSRVGEDVISGCLAEGDELDLAWKAARICVLRCLAVVKAAVGDLDKVDRIISVRGFVSSHPGFTVHSKVLDPASQLLLDLFGKAGRHVRTAVGVSSLPSGGLVEMELSVRLRS
ncbi:RidA family protein [Afifella sp. IM 167]|uniref:RidA family protein n=1 Tax=Afifella sp. IM 167 TaxID=2033586 RepID=UPI001CC93D97|nr:RidA family protein [Afifella sp. IM 167]MBZ8134095.1 hypothetical protein [Afifella sp. IM 167]